MSVIWKEGTVASMSLKCKVASTANQPEILTGQIRFLVIPGPSQMGMRDC